MQRRIAALSMVIASLAFGSAARAQVPRTMTVQGILRDAAGVPVETNTIFRFDLLDGMRVVWTETQTIVPRAGLFTIRLGDTAPLDPGLFAARLSLRVTVGTDVMDPIPLTAVPYALRAEAAESYDGDVSWGQLTDVPPGFADGTDDGTSYSAGAGLVLTGSSFAVDTSTVQARVSGSCPPGQSIRAIAADGSVTCGAPTIPSTTCPPGQAVTAIGTDGRGTCATLSGGRIVNVTVHVGSTRAVLATGSSIVLESFTVNKLSPTSILLIEGAISAFGAYAGAMQQGWRLGSGAEVLGQSITYTGHGWAITIPTRAVIRGHTTTGPQTMVFRYFTNDGRSDSRPFNVYNPNDTDDNNAASGYRRLGQTQSVYTVWEIEP